MRSTSAISAGVSSPSAASSLSLASLALISEPSTEAFCFMLAMLSPLRSAVLQLALSAIAPCAPGIKLASSVDPSRSCRLTSA